MTTCPKSQHVVQLPVQGDWFEALPERIRPFVDRNTGKPLRKMAPEDYKTFQKVKNHHKLSRLSRVAVNGRLRTRLMKDLGKDKYSAGLMDEVLHIPMDAIDRDTTANGVTSLQRVVRRDLEAMADRALRDAPDRTVLLHKYLRPGEADQIETYRDEIASETYRRAVAEMEEQDRQRAWFEQATEAERAERAKTLVDAWRVKPDRGESPDVPQLLRIQEQERATTIAEKTQALAQRLIRPKRPNPRVRARRAGRSDVYPNPGQAARALRAAKERDAPLEMRSARVANALFRAPEAAECIAESVSDDEETVVRAVGDIYSPAWSPKAHERGFDYHCQPLVSVSTVFTACEARSKREECGTGPISPRRLVDETRLVVKKEGERRTFEILDPVLDMADEPPLTGIPNGLVESTPKVALIRSATETPLTPVVYPTDETGTRGILAIAWVSVWAIMCTMCGFLFRAVQWLWHGNSLCGEKPEGVPDDVWDTACRLANQADYPDRTRDVKVLAAGLKHVRAGIKLRHVTTQKPVYRAAADAAWDLTAKMVEEDTEVVWWHVFWNRALLLSRVVVSTLVLLLVVLITLELLPVVRVGAVASGGVGEWWADLRSQDITVAYGRAAVMFSDVRRSLVASVNSAVAPQIAAVRASINPEGLGIPAVVASVALVMRDSWTSRSGVVHPLIVAQTNTGLVNSSEFVAPTNEGAYAFPNNTTNTVCLGFGNESRLSKDCKILTAEKTQECQSVDGKGATLMGWTASISHVLRKCLCNAHNALTNRHGAVPPKVQDDVCDVLPDFVAAVAGYDAHYLMHPMKEWANWFAKWPLNKQRAFNHSRATEDIVPGKVKAMVKRELSHKMPTKARLIQFYKTLATQAEFGPEFYSLQKVVTNVFRRKRMGDIDVTFASGMNPSELGTWMEDVLADGAVMFYERDGKNWDSSMQQSHARFRQGFYSSFDSRLAEFASQCDKVKGTAVFAGGLLRYSVNYTVKSGHNDTTLGNSLVNAAIAYAAFKRAGIPASILVAGDDLLVATYEYVNVESMIAIEGRYGITPEAQTFVDFERVSFISGIWMSDSERIGFVPQPGRLFARLWWTVSPPSKKKAEMYLRGVARGLMGVVSTLPVVREWVNAFDSRGSAIASDKCYTFRGSQFRFNDDGIYGSYYRRYGIERAELDACEQWLRTLPAEPLYIRHRVIDRIMEVDLADIGEREQLWTAETTRDLLARPRIDRTKLKPNPEYEGILPRRNGGLTANAIRLSNDIARERNKADARKADDTTRELEGTSTSRRNPLRRSN